MIKYFAAFILFCIASATVATVSACIMDDHAQGDHYDDIYYIEESDM